MLDIQYFGSRGLGPILVCLKKMARYRSAMQRYFDALALLEMLEEERLGTG